MPVLGTNSVLDAPVIPHDAGSRIAGLLHDTVLQSLVAARFAVQLGERADALIALEQAMREARAAMAELRRLTGGTR